MRIARTWRQQSSNLRLMGHRCGGCDELVFPKRHFCPACGSKELACYSFSGLGKVLSMTTVYEAPRGFAGQVPYVAGVIKLDEGPIVTAMLADVDPGENKIGGRARMVTRRIWTDGNEGPIVYGYKFRVDEE